jgi:hypothetical protein
MHVGKWTGGRVSRRQVADGHVGRWAHRQEGT